MKRLILSLALCTATFSSAQLFENFEGILSATAADAQILADAYVAPLGQSLTYSLNSGWASSAKTHKKLGFDLTIGTAFPSVSDAAKKFDINSLGLIRLDYDQSTANTVFGGGDPTLFRESITQAEFKLPGGFEEDLIFNSLPVPYVQAGIGLFFKTDVMVRYLPKIDVKGFEIDLIGVGLKHNLMQHFGLLDKLPLNLSLLASYSRVNGSYSLSETNQDQKLTIGVDTFLVQTLASLDFPIISVVGGFGYGKGDASMHMLGDYRAEFPGTTVDPLSSENSFSGTHALIGVRANLLFLKIFANYTLQEFNTLTAGFSFNFR
jgi:hypothetical protein